MHRVPYHPPRASNGRWRAIALSLLLSAAAVAPQSAVAAAPSETWRPIDIGAATTCADGSAVRYLEHAGDPRRVVLHLEGGGACFSAETCAFDGPDRSYIPSSLATPDFLAQRGGIFDLGNPENPLADHSFIYVPYCTGDAHLGTRTTRYSDDLVVEHKGFVNGVAALDHLAAAYPELEELVVTGISAGSIATPLYAGLAADRFPDARIVTIGDGSGMFPSNPVLNALIGNLWGSADAVPDWPAVDVVSVAEFGIPDLYRFAGQHAPGITFAKFDYAFDGTQAAFARLAGVPPDDLLMLIEANEAAIEEAGVAVASYIAPGEGHTVLGSPELYELEVEGVRLVDWIGALVAGETPPDVRCSDCR